MADNKRLTETIPAFRVTGETYDEIKKLMRDNRRERIGEVARFLIERGLAAYLRDGQLFEPSAADASAAITQSPEDDYMEVPVLKPFKPKRQKQTRRA